MALERHLLSILTSVFNIVLPKQLQVCDLFVTQRALYSRRKSHHERPRWDYRSWTDERTCRNKRLRSDAGIVEQNRADADQTSLFDVAPVQRRAMSNGYLSLENRWVRSMSNVNNRIVLDVGPVADANVMNITTNGAVAPDRSFFAEVYVTYNLSTGFDIRGWVNLRVNPSKRSNHSFGEIVT